MYSLQLEEYCASENRIFVHIIYRCYNSSIGTQLQVKIIILLFLHSIQLVDPSLKSIRILKNQ